MIIFDSGFLYAYTNDKDRHNNDATTIIEKSFKGQYGRMIVSNFVIDEVLTLAYSRTRNCRLSFDIKSFINEKTDDNDLFYKIFIDDKLMELTQEYFDIYCKKGLSFTDCSILACMKEFDIEHLASFDQGFKGLVKILPE